MNKLNSFITGSHAYGTPSKDSDIDICLLMSEEDSKFLWKITKENEMKTIKFGDINLIVFTKEKSFLNWKSVTDALIAQKPVTREKAIKEFHEAGFDGYIIHDKDG